MTQSLERPWKPSKFVFRCRCREIMELRKKINLQKKKNDNKIVSNRTRLYEGKAQLYPHSGFSLSLGFNDPRINRQSSRTIQIRYEENLSLLSKSIINSFQNKYIFYAMDDLLYLLGPNSKECHSLLELLYSSMLSLHNNNATNFFDIWIDAVYINETYKYNKFLGNNSQKIKESTQITLILHHINRPPIKKPEPIW